MKEQYLVLKGKAHFYLVVPENPVEAEIGAADELAEFIYKATGAKPSLKKECEIDGTSRDPAIFIGKTKKLSETIPQFDYSVLKDDGFFIKRIENSVFIDGAARRSLLYGAYEFLERVLAIRFYAEDCFDIPFRDTVELGDLDIEETPLYRFRSIQSDITFSNARFAAMLRTSNLWAPTIKKYGGGYRDLLYQPNDHSFFDLMPPDKYFKEHPDWYNTTDQSFSLQTMLFEKGGPSQLCLTNEEMTKEACKNLIGWVQSRPDAKYFMVGQMDMNKFCECERCRASYAKNGGVSGALIIFINKLAAAVKKWQTKNAPNREIVIQTFAYQQTLPPPVKEENEKFYPVNDDVIPSDNVMIKIAIDKADFFRPIDDKDAEHNIPVDRSIKAWTALTPRLYIWDYTCNFFGFFAYYANLYQLQDNVKYYSRHGIEQILTQSSNQCGKHYQVKLKSYLLSKLLWNADVDVDKLIKDFNVCYFGADVEPLIAEVTERFQSYYKQKNFYGVLHGGADYLKGEEIDIALLTDTHALFERAIDVVNARKDDWERKEIFIKRIWSYMITPEYMLLNNYDYYYPDDEKGKIKLAESFFDKTDALGITYYRESVEPLIVDLKFRLLSQGPYKK